MNIIYNGPENGPLFLFANGAGAPADSVFMTKIAQGLAEHGIKVARFNFNYMQQRIDNGTKRPPERAPKLIAQFMEVIATFDQPMVIGGKSMGGRMATMLADLNEYPHNKQIKAIACLGYPFHPAAKPEKLRTEHLNSIKQPILIIQGERDKLGSKDDVDDYSLPHNIDFLWLEDGDHDLKPRVKSGFNHEEHLTKTITILSEYILSNLK